MIYDTKCLRNIDVSKSKYENPDQIHEQPAFLRHYLIFWYGNAVVCLFVTRYSGKHPDIRIPNYTGTYSSGSCDFFSGGFQSNTSFPHCFQYGLCRWNIKHCCSSNRCHFAMKLMDDMKWIVITLGQRCHIPKTKYFSQGFLSRKLQS